MTAANGPARSPISAANATDIVGGSPVELTITANRYTLSTDTNIVPIFATLGSVFDWPII